MAASESVKKNGLWSRLFNWGERNEEPEPPRIKPETLMRLNELRARHTFVNVDFVDRDGQSYQSLIIDVDAKSHSIVIDELYPQERGLQVMPGETVVITSTGKGIPVKFTTSIVAIEMYDGSPAYRLALPQNVKADQRREYFRLPVHPDMGLRLQIPLEDSGMRSCIILNLSSTGVRFSIDRNITDMFRTDRMIRQARVTLAEGEVFYCDLEVRSYEYRKPPERRTLVGARLIDVPLKDQKLLDKFLIQKQRAARKDDQ